MKTKLFREQANHHLPWGVVDSSFLMTPVRWICSQIYALEAKKPHTTCDRRSTGLTVQRNTVWPTWHVLHWGTHVAQYLAHDIASVITTCTEYQSGVWPHKIKSIICVISHMSTHKYHEHHTYQVNINKHVSSSCPWIKISTQWASGLMVKALDRWGWHQEPLAILVDSKIGWFEYPLVHSHFGSWRLKKKSI